MAYIVQKGDTLSAIATRNKTRLNDVIKANPHIKNPSLIVPGDKIEIPAAGSAGGIGTTPRPAGTNTRPLSQGGTEPLPRPAGTAYEREGRYVGNFGQDLGANPEAISEEIATRQKGGEDSRNRLIEQLLSGIKGVESFKPEEKYKSLQEETGVKGIQERIGTFDEEINKTTDLLKKLESDITKRAAEGGFIQSESQRRRVLGVEQKPLTESLEELTKARGLETERLGMAQSDLATRFGFAKEEATRPLSLLKENISISKDLKDLFSPDKAERLDTDIQDVGGRKLLVNKQTGATIKDLGPADPTKMTETEKTRALKISAAQKARTVLEQNAAGNIDKKVNPDLYMRLRQDYAEVVGDASEFDDVFAPMLSIKERLQLGVGKTQI